MSTTMSLGRINPVYDDIFERLEKIEWNNKKPTLHSCLLNQYFVPDIKKVIFNKPATIIIWNDNTKTVVKCTENDVWDAEKGFVMAYLKKIIGVAKLRKGIKKWVKPQEEAEEEFSKNIADHLNSVEDFKTSLGSLLVDIFKSKNSEE